MSINSADKKNKQLIVTGKPALLDIRGKNTFISDMGGVQDLGLYVNLNLPSDPVKRQQLSRGGWTVWFEYDSSNVTGLLGPVPISRYAGTSTLITHTWRHGVKVGQPWKFGILVEAFDGKGRPVSFPLTLSTRNVRIG